MNGYLLGYDYYVEDVPYVQYFYEDYALHGAYWHNNFGDTDGKAMAVSICRPLTPNGCIISQTLALCQCTLLMS